VKSEVQVGLGKRDSLREVDVIVIVIVAVRRSNENVPIPTYPGVGQQQGTVIVVLLPQMNLAKNTET
jgi:hypothetical protein